MTRTKIIIIALAVTAIFLISRKEGYAKPCAAGRVRKGKNCVPITVRNPQAQPPTGTIDPEGSADDIIAYTQSTPELKAYYDAASAKGQSQQEANERCKESGYSSREACKGTPWAISGQPNPSMAGFDSRATRAENDERRRQKELEQGRSEAKKKRAEAEANFARKQRKG